MLETLSKIVPKINVLILNNEFFLNNEISPLRMLVTSRAIISSIQRQIYYETLDIPNIMTMTSQLTNVNKIECGIMICSFLLTSCYLHLKYNEMSKIDSKLSNWDSFVSMRRRVQIAVIFIISVFFRNVDNAI